MAPLPVDCFTQTVAHVTETARGVKDAMDAAVRRLEQSRDERSNGAPLGEVVDGFMSAGGREMRLGVTEAFHDYERATAAVRACIIRTLVDEHGLSFTQVGEKLRISRQAVGRLYRDHQAHARQV